MSVVITNNHVAEAHALLAEQFKRGPNMNALLNTFTSQVQTIEDAFAALLFERNIDAATGVQLDGLGQIVGERRNGADDDRYRIRLKVRRLINRSNGTANELLAIVQLITGSSALPPTFSEPSPASFLITTGGAVDDGAAQEINKAVMSARSGGIGTGLLYSGADDANTFTFANSSSPEPSATQGFLTGDFNNQVNGTMTGGNLAGLISNT